MDQDSLYALGQAEPVGEFFEMIITGIYTRLLNPGDRVIDCGANWGLHTEPLSRLVGPEGKVWAIEALPDRAEALHRHLHANGFSNVTVVPKAVSRRPGTANFVLVRGDDAYSGLRERRGIPAPVRDSTVTISVPVCTLDELLDDESQPIRFMKMDLEGGEYDALRGARALLARSAPVVIFENGRQEAADVYGYSKEAWFGFFDACNYRVTDLFGRPFTPEDWPAQNIPWYFIAARIDSPDARALDHIVPAAIRACLAG